MFEYKQVLSSAVVSTGVASDAAPPSGPARERIRELQSHIHRMQATKLDTRAVPTHSAIAGLLPGGALERGSAYSVEGSGMLLMTLLAGPSAAGEWCAVVGIPEFGVEAAKGLGIDLDRMVLIPHPGDRWPSVTAAVAEVMSVVVTRAPGRINGAGMLRLAERLRRRGTTLIVLGPWPRSEALLSVSDCDWGGIGEGFGHLSARQATVTVRSRVGGRIRSARLWLPDREDRVRRVEAVAPPRIEAADRHRVEAAG